MSEERFEWLGGLGPDLKTSPTLAREQRQGNLRQVRRAARSRQRHPQSVRRVREL
jgi:hypothetical protein